MLSSNSELYFNPLNSHQILWSLQMKKPRHRDLLKAMQTWESTRSSPLLGREPSHGSWCTSESYFDPIYGWLFRNLPCDFISATSSTEFLGKDLQDDVIISFSVLLSRSNIVFPWQDIVLFSNHELCHMALNPWTFSHHEMNSRICHVSM